MPSLWTVHQNLQTLQADLSRKAYARALQTELPLKEAPPRLTMLASTALSKPVMVAQASPPVTAKPQLPTPATVAVPPSSAPAVASKPEVAKPPAARSEAVTTTKPDTHKAEVVKPAPPQKEAVPAAPGQAEAGKTVPGKATGLDEATRQQLQAAVEAWAQAWSAQNMAAYLGAYAPDFTPSKWTPRATWEAQRTSRIVGRQFVRVSVSNFSFENKGSKTAVRFNQVYESDNIQSKHRKRLDLVQIDGRWKIVRETVISQ
jgi:uncharacterized protein YchJ